MEVKVDVVECGGVRRTMVLGWRWWRSLWCEDGRGGVGGSAWGRRKYSTLRDRYDEGGVDGVVDVVMLLMVVVVVAGAAATRERGDEDEDGG
ncbi:hypothetical protein Tco_0273460 [Tanacetum coccineum]